jgi:hypothetical protein
MFPIQRKSLFALMVLCLAVFFTGCDVDSLQQEVVVLTETDMPELAFASLPPPEETEEQRRRRCFTFNFPVEIVMADGTVLAAEDYPGLRENIQTVRESGERANFVYPFTVTLANGNERTIENFLQFRRLANICREIYSQGGDEPCFNFVYPVDLEVDGEPVSVNSGAEWRQVAEDAGPLAVVRIEYPVTVVRGDRTIDLPNARALNRLRLACEDLDDMGRRCFRYVYPLDLTVDGEVVTIAGPTEWGQVIANAEDRTTIRLNFPFFVTVPNRDEPIEIESRLALRGLRDLCN